MAWEGEDNDWRNNFSRPPADKNTSTSFWQLQLRFEQLQLRFGQLQLRFEQLQLIILAFYFSLACKLLVWPPFSAFYIYNKIKQIK